MNDAGATGEGDAEVAPEEAEGAEAASAVPLFAGLPLADGDEEAPTADADAETALFPSGEAPVSKVDPEAESARSADEVGVPRNIAVEEDKPAGSAVLADGGSASPVMTPAAITPAVSSGVSSLCFLGGEERTTESVSRVRDSAACERGLSVFARLPDVLDRVLAVLETVLVVLGLVLDLFIGSKSAP
ncbi:hypothetical protein CDO73_04910 [Saccharibacillus sp. O23]|nr:hypothetical protein CDO73_04910 [Saccharibacillus sp. O23]